MAEIIHKYPIPDSGVTEIDLPGSATVLHFDDQRGMLTIWVRLDAEAPKIRWTFHLLATGAPLPERILEHIGTALHSEGDEVWHLFREHANYIPVRSSRAALGHHGVTY